MWYVLDVLYVPGSCFAVRGCAVSRRYTDICNCAMFSVVNVYLVHLKLCVVCVYGQRYVYCGECNVVSMSVMSTPPVLCNLLVRMVVELCTLGLL